MNKRTKIMLVLLSAATLTAGALGLAACKTDKGNNNGGGNNTEVTEIRAVYNSYVTYAQANNQTVLSYEDWLETIKGATGDKGDKGDKGDIGVGIYSVTVDGDFLVVTYTDPNKAPARIPLPDTVTHVHAYDDEDVSVIIPPTATTEGFGYKTCTHDECNHVEAVVLNKLVYDISVVSDGKPVAGVDVTINGAKATTDKKGVAKLTGFGRFNDYIVTVSGGSYVAAQEYRTGKGGSLEIEVTKQLRTYTDSTTGESVANITEAGVYKLTFASEFGTYGNVKLRFVGGNNSAKNYRISSDDPYFGMVDNSYNSVLTDGAFEKAVGAQNTTTEDIYVTLDYMRMMFAGIDTNKSYDLVLKVEELTPPAQGVNKDMAYIAEAGKTYNLPTDGSEVYYKFVNDDSDVKAIKFTLNNVEGTADVFSYDFMTGWSDKVVELGSDQITLVEGSVANTVARPYYLKVKAADGAANASFSFTTVAPLGTAANPVTVTAGTAAEFTGTLGISHFFKFTATEGDYVITPNSGDIHYFNHKPDSDENGTSIYSQTSIHLAAGDYWFKVNSDGEKCGMTIRAFEDSDYGYSEEFAKVETLTDNKVSVTAIAGTETTYYKVTATKAGVLRVKTDVKGEGTVYIVGNGLNLTKTVSAGDEIIIRAENNLDDYESFGFGVSIIDEGAAEAHTFKIVKVETVGETTTKTPVAGATVTVTVDATHVYTAQTDASGVVTLDFVAGAHALTVTKDGWYYDTTVIGNNTQTGANDLDYELSLRDDGKDYTFNANVGGAPIEGAKIAVTQQLSDGSVLTVAQGVTGVDGTYTVKLFAPSSGDLKYKVELPEGYEDYGFTDAQLSSMYIGKGTAENISIAPEQLATYTVIIKDSTGKGIKGVTVSLSQAMEDWWTMEFQPGATVASGVSDENGVVVIKCAEIKIMSMPAQTAVGATFSTVPDGFTLAFTTFELNATTLEITAEGVATKPDPVDPDNPDNPNPDNPNPDNPDVPEETEVNGSANLAGAAGAEVKTGENELVNSAALNYYSFTATEGGVYTFKFYDDNEKGYIQYLSAGNGSVSRQTKLIEEGRQVALANGIILGENRRFNRCYEVTLTLTRGQSVTFGYQTATEDAGTATLKVAKKGSVEEPEAPAEVELTLDTPAEIDLSAGPVTVTFTTTAYTGYEITINNTDVTVVEIYNDEEYDVDLEEWYGESYFTVSDSMNPNSETVTYVISGTGTVTVTITEAE